MCVYSMIADHYHDKWTNPPYQWPPVPQPPHKVVPVSYPMPLPIPMPLPTRRPLTQEEVDEMRELLKKAKKYDEENDEKDCELAHKKEKLRQIAKQLGIDNIEFP